MAVFPIYFANDHLTGFLVSLPAPSRVLTRGPHGYSASAMQSETAPREPGLEMTPCVLFVMDFIIINDSVPSEDRGLCLALALQCFIRQQVW